MIEIYWKRRRKSNYSICSEPILGDIETAHNEDFTKCWMVSCQLKFAGSYHLIRTPSAFVAYLRDMIDRFDLNEKRRMVIYFHNQSFDLSYLLPWIQFGLEGYDTRQGIFDGRNRVIMYRQGPFDFRCSYLLSACSLERWGDEMNAEHRKKVGMYNYDKLIYQDTELDLNETIYDEYDILSLEDCLRKQMSAYEDDICSVPLTSTGYIRRILRNSAVNDSNYRNDIFLESRLTADAYDVVLPSYAGGYTHENRYLKNATILPNRVNIWENGKVLDLMNKLLKHKDFRSHYPTQIVNYLLPWGKCDLFFTIQEAAGYRAIKGRDITMEDLFEMWPEYTTISVIQIKDMTLKSEKITMPFMQISKMRDKSAGFKVYNDNGRALKTFGTFTTDIDNLTLKIIADQYDFEYRILKVYRFKNAKCPECIASVINDLFKKKSDYKIEYKRLRDLYGESDQRTIDALFNLNQTKKLLNACYGCMATAPVRDQDDIDFVSYYNGDIEDPYTSIKPVTLGMKQEQLDKFYNSRNSFLPYQVGVMVCASARYELYEYITTIGYENILYGDTDSLFYISDDEIEARVAALNAEKHKTAQYIINSEGERVYYDVFEDEPEVLAFRGLHSKCYAVVEKTKQGPELVATIAGVPKRTIIGMIGDHPIYLTREEELAGITVDQKIRSEKKLMRKRKKDPEAERGELYDPFEAINNLYDGRSFYVNTGVSAKYLHEKPHVEEIDGHLIETSGGCIIRKLPEKIITDGHLNDYNIEFSEAYMEGI